MPGIPGIVEYRLPLYFPGSKPQPTIGSCESQLRYPSPDVSGMMMRWFPPFSHVKCMCSNTYTLYTSATRQPHHLNTMLAGKYTSMYVYIYVYVYIYATCNIAKSHKSMYVSIVILKWITCEVVKHSETYPHSGPTVGTISSICGWNWLLLFIRPSLFCFTPFIFMYARYPLVN